MTDHEFTVESARHASERGELAEWVREFLASPGSDNADLGELLADERSHWTGPTKLRIDQLHRLVGPPGDPVLCPVDDDYWRDDVEDMEDQVEEGWEPPPMIVTYRDDQLVLEDGNHRVEGMRRAGETEVWAVVCFQDDAARQRFETAKPG